MRVDHIYLEKGNPCLSWLFFYAYPGWASLGEGEALRFLKARLFGSGVLQQLNFKVKEGRESLGGFTPELSPAFDSTVLYHS